MTDAILCRTPGGSPHTNKSRLIWIKYGLYVYICIYIHMQMSHVSHEWVMSHMNEWCHIWQVLSRGGCRGFAIDGRRTFCARRWRARWHRYWGKCVDVYFEVSVLMCIHINDSRRYQTWLCGISAIEVRVLMYIHMTHVDIKHDCFI